MEFKEAFVVSELESKETPSGMRKIENTEEHTCLFIYLFIRIISIWII